MEGEHFRGGERERKTEVVDGGGVLGDGKGRREEGRGRGGF